MAVALPSGRQAPTRAHPATPTAAYGPAPAPARPAAAARLTALWGNGQPRPPAERAPIVPAPAPAAVGRAAAQTRHFPKRADAEIEHNLAANNPRHDAAAAS